MLTLTLAHGGEDEHGLPLSADRPTFLDVKGRHARVSLQSSDFTVGRVDYDHGRWVLYPLEADGLFLNGRRAEHPITLYDGDELRVGRSAMRVCDREDLPQCGAAAGSTPARARAAMGRSGASVSAASVGDSPADWRPNSSADPDRDSNASGGLSGLSGLAAPSVLAVLSVLSVLAVLAVRAAQAVNPSRAMDRLIASARRLGRGPGRDNCNDPARQESTRRDSTCQDSARRDSARRDSARQDSARQDSARNESAHGHVRAARGDEPAQDVGQLEPPRPDDGEATIDLPVFSLARWGGLAWLNPDYWRVRPWRGACLLLAAMLILTVGLQLWQSRTHRRTQLMVAHLVNALDQRPARLEVDPRTRTPDEIVRADRSTGAADRARGRIAEAAHGPAGWRRSPRPLDPQDPTLRRIARRMDRAAAQTQTQTQTQTQMQAVRRELREAVETMRASIEGQEIETGTSEPAWFGRQALRDAEYQRRMLESLSALDRALGSLQWSGAGPELEVAPAVDSAPGPASASAWALDLDLDLDSALDSAPTPTWESAPERGAGFSSAAAASARSSTGARGDRPQARAGARDESAASTGGASTGGALARVGSLQLSGIAPFFVSGRTADAPGRAGGPTGEARPDTPQARDRSRRVVYVVDASGSMVDSLALVGNYLQQRIGKLTSRERFAVFFYRGDGVIKLPATGLAPADERSKRRLEQWLDPEKGLVEPHGRGDIGEALFQALQCRPDDIYLVSDHADDGLIHAVEATLDRAAVGRAGAAVGGADGFAGELQASGNPERSADAEAHTRTHAHADVDADAHAEAEADAEVGARGVGPRIHVTELFADGATPKLARFTERHGGDYAWLDLIGPPPPTEDPTGLGDPLASADGS